jgi:4-carboxymuconolactone decarboxylase
MAANSEPSGAQKMFGDFAPGLVHLTDDVLFGEVWERTELSPRDRSLVTVACLTTNGNTEQLVFHLDLARRNGCTEEELKRGSHSHCLLRLLAAGHGRHRRRRREEGLLAVTTHEHTTTGA